MASVNNIITNFQLLYQEIYDIYVSSKNPIERWTLIASLVNDKNNDFSKFFFALKKEPNRKQIKLDYQRDLKQLSEQIKTENVDVVKCSLIITALHLMFYDLLSSEGNYYFSLNGQNEMYILKKN